MSDEACKMPCHRCIMDFDIKHPQTSSLMWSDGRMVLCDICGNKRCPHASDHRLKCTGSNATGQPGSIYRKPLNLDETPARPV